MPSASKSKSGEYRETIDLLFSYNSGETGIIPVFSGYFLPGISDQHVPNRYPTATEYRGRILPEFIRNLRR
ncbi:MAG: hypothetical protein Q8908_09480 [Bacteroidota bacterium]|nr:hypothetical protein [Bacteroidota bacterium]